jgi:hypothetical protein
METFDNLEQKTFALEVTDNSKTYLNSAAAWCKFMAILGFIGIGFIILGALLIIPLSSILNTFSPTSIPFSLISIIYLGLAVLVFFPTLYLYRFSQKTTNALLVNNPIELEEGIKNMKRYWKFKGIIAIVALAYLIIFIPIILIIAFAFR